MADEGIRHKNIDAHQQGKFLQVSTATKEILQAVLNKSSRTGIQISIKSTKSYHNSQSELWFYIKVTSKLKIDKHHLEGKNKNPALYTILEYMQSLEYESHLCILNPCDLELPGQSSCQQNFILEGENLNVLNEVRKSKKKEESVLHLRIHDNKLHMMKECACIHSYLCQLRIFRPKADMYFTMKIGEAVSHTDFRVESRRKLCQFLPSIVTDAAFYIQDSDVEALSDTVVPCTIDPVLTSVKLQTLQNEDINRSLHISSVGLYIPVQHTVTTSICTLTFFGPGYLPLDVTVPCDLLTSVDWSRYKMNVDSNIPTPYKGLLSHHSSVSLKSSGRGCETGPVIIQIFILLQFADTNESVIDHQEISQNLELLCGTSLISVIQETTDKVLQPVINHAKNRDVVMRSISGICKAVTDIVSMSSNEQFRAAALQYMKVRDTVQLGVDLNQKLTDISHRKHAGVWEHCQTKYSSSFKVGQDVFGCVSKRRQEGFFSDAGTRANAFVSTSRGENVVLDDRNVGKLHGYHSNGNNDLSIDSDIATDHACIKSYSDNLNIKHNNMKTASYKENCENYEKSTESRSLNPEQSPEVVKITEGMEKVSPFQQLVETSPDKRMDITPDLLKITKGMKDVSPFQQPTEADHIYTVDADVGVEDPCPPRRPLTTPDRKLTSPSTTPNVTQVTQCMKDVSPFQQLACDEHVVPASPNVITEDPYLPHQVHGQVQEHLVNSQITQNIYNKHVNSVNKFSLKLGTNNNSLHNKSLAKFELLPPSSQRKESSAIDKNASDLFQNLLGNESDFELLNSDEFVPTLETVSEFINDMKCEDKFQMTPGRLGDSKYDVVVNDEQNLSQTVTLAQPAKVLPNRYTVYNTGNMEEESKEDDDVSNSPDVSKKPAGKDVQDIDDWFNDVLLEVGEWLD